jgi:hypothetical protein
MPFDGSGNYVPPGPPTFPAVTATTISSAYFNATINDIGTALSNCLTRDNQGKPSVNMNWNGYNLTNVGVLGITGATTLASTLAVTGATTLASTLGISSTLTVANAAAAEALRAEGGSGAYAGNVVLLGVSGITSGYVLGKDASNNITHSWSGNAGAERMRIQPSGNVGIGTATPGAKLAVASSGEIAQLVTSVARGSGQNYQSFYDPTGRKGYIGYGNPATDNMYLTNDMAAGLIFQTNATERMRISSAGLVGIGRTPDEKLDVEGVVQALSPNFVTKGAVILRDAAGNPGACYIQAVSNNGVSQYSFIKMDNGTLSFSGNVVPNADGAVSCGLGSNRWNTVYAVTGTINTSDATTKRLLGSTDDTLLDAVGDIDIILYQFLDAIEIKGEKAARHHAGITAQALQSALESRGIDPSQCAAFCADTLEDGSVRYGVRYTELLVLMQAWTRREMSRLVSRVAALEGA